MMQPYPLKAKELLEIECDANVKSADDEGVRSL